MSDAALIEAGSRPEAAAAPRRAAGGLLTDGLFVLGLLTIPLQAMQIGMAQPGQLWMLVALVFIVLSRTVKVSPVERSVFVIFIVYATALTLLEAYPRTKPVEQIFKFLIIYPGFYYVGRGFGTIYTRKPLPVGYGFLALLLAFEMFVEHFKLPFLYQELDFAEGALHGTFKERNWIGMFFFMLSYFIFAFGSERRFWATAVFVALNAVVTYLSGSKTIIVGCGIAVLLRSRIPILLKIIAIVAGTLLYWQFFGSDLSGDQLRVRVEDERGLAFAQSLVMLSRNLFGYGFGYVEAYFSQLSIEVKGLGAGTNSVFSVPLDLMIIAGFVGLGAWLVFFCGVGLGATTVLAPIAALSLLNPLHQSEIVYFFLGMLVSGTVHAGVAQDALPRSAPAPSAEMRAGL